MLNWSLSILKFCNHLGGARFARTKGRMWFIFFGLCPKKMNHLSYFASEASYGLSSNYEI
jgi:hypothetical protein